MKKMSVLFLFFVNVLCASQPYVMPSLMGQLGNQMFQIAAATSLALEHGAEVIVPDLKNEKQWDIPTNRRYVLWRVNESSPPRAPSSQYHESSFTYSEIPYKENMQIKGYFQSEKYFEKHKEEIINLFAPSEKIMKYLAKNYPEICFCPNTVSIHIRAYLAEEQQQCYYINGLEYVDRAMSLFPDDYLFVIFSDNIPWVKDQLSGLNKKIIYIEGEKHYNDLYLMSLCKHNIISNSTFSWWAAYLNLNPDKLIIAPGKWFKPAMGMDTSDLYPQDWVILE